MSVPTETCWTTAAGHECPHARELERLRSRQAEAASQVATLSALTNQLLLQLNDQTSPPGTSNVPQGSAHLWTAYEPQALDTGMGMPSAAPLVENGSSFPWPPCNEPMTTSPAATFKAALTSLRESNTASHGSEI